MLKRLICLATAFALAATSASAAPGFGAADWSATSDSGSYASGDSGAGVLAALVNLFNLRFETSASSPAPTPIAERARDPHTSHYDCEATKKDEQEKMAEAKRIKGAGPEPVYLAF